MDKWVKANKPMAAAILVLIIASVGVGGLGIAKSVSANSTMNLTPAPQQVIITDSNGFSVNGNVTIEQVHDGGQAVPTRTAISSQPETQTIEEEGITGEYYKPVETKT